MKEAENSGAKQRGPSLSGSTRVPNLPAPAKSFVCKLTKVWEFSMMLHMNGQIIIFFQNMKNTSGWEKLVTPGQRTELTLREGKGSCQARRTQSKGSLQERNSPSKRELTWNNTLQRISGERAPLREEVFRPHHTPSKFPSLSFPQANKSEQRATFLVLRGEKIPPGLKK